MTRRGLCPICHAPNDGQDFAQCTACRFNLRYRHKRQYDPKQPEGQEERIAVYRGRFERGEPLFQ